MLRHFNRQLLSGAADELAAAFEREVEIVIRRFQRAGRTSVGEERDDRCASVHRLVAGLPLVWVALERWLSSIIR